MLEERLLAECKVAQNDAVAALKVLSSEIEDTSKLNIKTFEVANRAQLDFVEKNNRALLLLLNHWLSHGCHMWVRNDWAESAWCLMDMMCKYTTTLPNLLNLLPEDPLFEPSRPHRYMWSGLQRMIAKHLPDEVPDLVERMRALDLPVSGLMSLTREELERVRSIPQMNVESFNKIRQAMLNDNDDPTDTESIQEN